jgi:WD40 repeat protein
VWALDGSARPIVLEGHRGIVLSAVFSPDGKRVVTASGDGTARVWALDGAAKPVELVVPGRAVPFASWSPDGERVVTGSYDGTARVFSVHDGSRALLELRGHGGDLLFARWSADGERILTVSRDGSAGVWPVALPALEQLLRDATTDCLRPEMNRVYLGEPDARARAHYEACERSHHRPPFYPSARSPEE